MNEESTNLDALMARLADGDRAAFAPAFRLLWPRVNKLCLGLMRQQADADDAAQTAMERILARASEYDPKRPALAWALGIAAWECRTLKRRRQRRREVGEELSENVAAGTTPEAVEGELLDRDLLRAALDAMGQLAEADQETLMATFADEALKADVSGATQRKRGNARSNDCEPHFGGFMASIELSALESRARWAYERARLLRAVLAFVPMLLIVGVAAWLGRRPVTVMSLGLGVYAAGALLLWYGREPAKAVLPGILAGLVPLCFSLCATHMGHVCTGEHCYSLCVPACTAGGLGAGILVARFGLKQARGIWFWLLASGLAVVTGSMGCSCVGYAGLIGLNLSYGLGLLPGAVQALRARLGKSS